MIHLIGVLHRAQASATGQAETDSQKEYAETLRRTIRNVNPALVAEEYSTEAEQENKTISITRTVAAELGVPHRFCDPHKDERARVGYLSAEELHPLIWMNDENWNISNEEAEAKAWAICIGKYFAIREGLWLDSIRDVIKKEIVFVLGDGHVDSFTKILESEGVEVSVVARGIGVTAEDNARMEAGLRYLNEHPNCVNEQWGAVVLAEEEPELNNQRE